jgi:hypothetical protein
MENRIDILNELKELSPALAAIQNVHVFTVPDGYFEYLSTDILLGIENANGSATLSSSEIGRDIPVGYFDSLAGSILNKIKTQDVEDAAAEIRALSPMLYSIQNENVFEVPQGYFKNLAESLVNKVNPQAKVISLQRRSSTFFKYAVAAAFTGVMALGVFKFTAKTDDIMRLPEYVTAGLKVNDVDGELAKIADADIVKFLEANGSDVKAALVANSVDENELPSEEDYLMDEKALDKYLNSINIDDSKN